MQLIPVMEQVFNQPPIPFNPAQQSLKGWAMYCLRDRGFKVVYAQNADFAIETKGGEKVYFKVTDQPASLESERSDETVGWIVHDSTTQRTQVVAPAADRSN